MGRGVRNPRWLLDAAGWPFKWYDAIRWLEAVRDAGKTWVPPLETAEARQPAGALGSEETAFRRRSHQLSGTLN